MVIFALLMMSVAFGIEPNKKGIFLKNILESYKWKKRFLVLVTNKEDIVLIKEVQKFFKNNECRNHERELELIKIIIEKDYDPLLPLYFKNKKGIWLIGYDGKIKAYSRDNSLLLNLYDIIDIMPIRKLEIEAPSIYY